jgi:hypothetical protein
MVDYILSLGTFGSGLVDSAGRDRWITLDCGGRERGIATMCLPVGIKYETSGTGPYCVPIVPCHSGDLVPVDVGMQPHFDYLHRRGLKLYCGLVDKCSETSLLRAIQYILDRKR